jgi:hypothetical protein
MTSIQVQSLRGAIIDQLQNSRGATINQHPSSRRVATKV